MRPEIRQLRDLDDYEAAASLTHAVRELREVARQRTPALRGRRIWMISSTAQGGGVAEMLSTQVGLLRHLGLEVEWEVIQSDIPAFFRLTKRLHNLIHGTGDPRFDAADRELFESVNRRNAHLLRERIRPEDIVIVHDPQPMALAAALRESVPVAAIWRCHIGLDDENAATRAAWAFLQPYAAAYDRAVFSVPEYVPPLFADRAAIIHPGIDPLSPKNRELHLHKIVAVLANSGLAAAPGPVVRPPFQRLATRLQRDGSFRPALLPEDIGLLSRPIVTQISRWDRLKGFVPLMRAFARLKQDQHRGGPAEPAQRRRVALVRLVLAGPDASGIQDDPEAREVLQEVAAAYAELDPLVQDDIAVVALPMGDVTENALMVNALQRASSIVAQNSLREGFGLTVTEAMWKRIPVLSNRRACGPRHQIRDGVDGRLVDDPENEREIARTLREMLADTQARNQWGRAAQRHVHDDFLIFSQVRAWLDVMAQL